MALVLAVAATIGRPAPVHAADTWYVAPGGSDSNTCLSSAAPCATINGALAKAGFAWPKQRGQDTIRVAAGTYTSSGDVVALIYKGVTLSGGWNSAFTAQTGLSTVDGQGARQGISVSGGTTATIETPQSAAPSAPFARPLQALLLDSVGSPVAGAAVTFAAPASGPSGTFAPAGAHTTTATTGGDGLASAALTANALTGGYTVSATVGGLPAEATFQLRNAIWYVSWAGDDDNDCLAPVTPCAAIDGVLGKPEFVAGGLIRIAAGPYTGSGAQVVSLDQSAILSGGWDSAFAAQNGRSVLDTQGARWGIHVHRDVTAAVERLTIVHGLPDGSGEGGGIYNLLGRVNAWFTPATGDLIGVQAHLGPLEGEPGYHPLLWASGARNAGNPAGCTDHLGQLLSTDQRGVARAGRCDIGAYEAMPLEFSAKAAHRATVYPGDPISYTITVRNSELIDVPGVRVTDTLPVVLTLIPGSLAASGGACAYDRGVITWAGDLGADSDVTVAFEATVGHTGGMLANSAVIRGGGEMLNCVAIVPVWHRLSLPVLSSVR